MKPKWLDRRIAQPGPYLMLCLSEKEYLAVMKSIKCNHFDDWVSPNADATAHHLTNAKGVMSIVCLRGWVGRNPVEVAGMLVHEAVHVWQWYAEKMGERNPGSEQEAYAVQAIAQELMAEFARRMAK